MFSGAPLNEPCTISMACCKGLRGHAVDLNLIFAYQIHSRSTIRVKKASIRPSIRSHRTSQPKCLRHFTSSPVRKQGSIRNPSYRVASSMLRQQQLLHLCQRVVSIAITSLLWSSLCTGWLLSKACLTGNASASLRSFLLRLLYLILAPFSRKGDAKTKLAALFRKARPIKENFRDQEGERIGKLALDLAFSTRPLAMAVFALSETAIV